MLVNVYTIVWYHNLASITVAISVLVVHKNCKTLARYFWHSLWDFVTSWHSTTPKPLPKYIISISNLHPQPLKCLQKQHTIPDWVISNNTKQKMNIAVNLLDIMSYPLRMKGIQERNALFIPEKILGVKLCLNLCQSSEVILEVLLPPNTSLWVACVLMLVLA